MGCGLQQKKLLVVIKNSLLLYHCTLKFKFTTKQYTHHIIIKKNKMPAKIVFPVLHSAFALGIVACIACNGSNANAVAPSPQPPSSIVATDAEGFKKIFDGKTLDGWDGDTAYWSVQDGALTGQITPDKLIKTNSFIIWQGGQPADFELKAQFKITETGNSGINYRSEMFPGIPYALKGYQADIDGKNNYTGQNYEERGRTTLAYRGQRVTIPTVDSSKAVSKRNAWVPVIVDGSLGSSDSLKGLIKADDWNDIHLVIKGNHLQHFVNGVLMSDVTDNDTVHRKDKGLLGVQVHVGPPMKVQFRNIRIKEL